jgi:ABC-type uncharacterized transport system substrate-binding protein
MKYILSLLLITSNSISATMKIAVVHSYERGSWTEEGTRGVKKFFQENKSPVQVDEHIYDYIKARTNSKNLKNKVLSDLLNGGYNLFIIFDDEATDDLLPSLNAKKIPIVVTGINKNPSDANWNLPDKSPERYFTGITERYPFEQSLKMLKRIKPTVTKISILTSENRTSKIITGQMLQKFKSHNGEYSGVKLDKVHQTSSWKEWKEIISNYNYPDTAFWILVPWNVNDEKGKEVDLRILGEYYRKHSKIPEMGIVSISDKLGFVSTFSVSGEDLGYQASQVASQILFNNKSPRDIPFVPNSSVRFIINKQRADQLNIKIPSEFLEFAKIERKIPMEYFR